ncbi:MAG: alpha/beta hydrolase [Proteobacteria bacterium]|nr:alpha/beta hydrolase [Pseudomonadota bacterium]
MKIALSFLKLTLFVIVGVYISLSLMLLAFQSSFIYYPDKKVYGTPAVLGLSYDEVSFKAGDGVKLTGWFIPAGDARGVVLFCHGNAGNISHRLETLHILNRLGLSTFIFDYRGYGRSEGKPSEKGTYLDAQGAWNYLTRERKIPQDEIIIFGRSLGAAIASHLAKGTHPKALIIESGFTSMSAMAAQLYPYLPVRFLSRFKYDTRASISVVRSPLLIIHSRNDEIVPFSHGRKLFQAASGPKKFLELKGRHNDGFIVSGGEYINGLESFLSNYILQNS